MDTEVVLAEIKKLRSEVADLKKIVDVLAENSNGPVPGKKCTIHTNCRGGGLYCNDGGPTTLNGIGW